MKIAQWMKHPVITMKPADSTRHAREIMEKRRINQLPVLVNGRLVGIVTDRDLRDAFPSLFDALEPGGRGPAVTDPSAIPIEDVMTAKVLTLTSDASVGEGARLMRRERIGALPIVEAGRLVGILTRSDVLDAFAAASRG